MTFKPGQTGKPAGRAPGSRNKKTLAREAALFDHAGDAIAHRDVPPDQEVTLQIVADSAEIGGGRPLPVRVDAGGAAARCGAADAGATLVNNNENTSAAVRAGGGAKSRST